MSRRKWTDESLIKSCKESLSIRGFLIKLGLVPTGGNYQQINFYIKKNKIDIKHFTGKAWNKGLKGRYIPIIPLSLRMTSNSQYQSYKLKNRLFKEGLKIKECEECGWKKVSKDGRLPLELDHINGNKHDNRLENLRILCPNCHSLKPTHRGRNKRHA